MTSAATRSFTLPSLIDQAERLIDLGVLAAADLDPAALRDLVRTDRADDRADDRAGGEDSLLVVDPGLAPPSRLAPLLVRDGRPGFVVADMTDVDEFSPVPEAARADRSPYHLVHGVTRGDELANRSPAEALAALTAAGRSPLTLTEGMHWVLQRPDVLERNLCFMTIGSRLRRGRGGYDARTPAIWISNGTGRDGRDRRNATKIGWCWWNNRHTWLGFASASGRGPVSVEVAPRPGGEDAGR